MSTKYKFKTAITPLAAESPVMYFADAAYAGTVDVPCDFDNQSATYKGFKFLPSSQTVAGLTEVYNSGWLDQGYRTIYVSSALSDFLIGLSNARRPATCFIFKTLENCSLSNTDLTVTEGASYTTNVITEMLSSPTISIIMNGVDVTESVWNPATKVIYIAAVTGNLSINIKYSGLPADYVELKYI